MTRTTEIHWRHWKNEPPKTPGVPLIALSTGNVTRDPSGASPGASLEFHLRRCKRWETHPGADYGAKNPKPTTTPKQPASAG